MEMDSLQALMTAFPFSKIMVGVGRWCLTPCLIFGAIFCFEYLAGADLQRYRSRNFVIDLLYYVFYSGGIFTLLVYNPLTAVLAPSLSVLQGGLLAPFPPLLAYVIYLIYLDFVSYWWHRFQHANRFLWAFHSTHHSQTQLTSPTGARLHVMEMAISAVFTYVVITLPLGEAARSGWAVVALVWVVKLLESLYHAELPWRFGPAYYVLVSPVFHSIHHAADPRDHNKNYARILSLWDYLFGTAAASTSRPQVYGGVESMGLAESFTGQVLAPFKHCVRLLTGRRRASLA